MSLDIHPLAASVWPLLSQYLIWIVLGAILLIGLLVGRRDVPRFSLTRTWAISSVCLTESLRRRILWITPLAMFGVVLIEQFQHPLDEMDAIRETTKYALFASGLLIFISMIILACTNLPREIDTRVIYTVVTKPTTRLEIVLGKVVGFARVALLILIIMGLFTYVYLRVRAWDLGRQLTARLEAGTVSETSRHTLEEYQRTGLLTAKTVELPEGMDILSRIDPSGDRVWVHAQGEQEIVVPFDLAKGAFVPPDDPGAEPGANGVFIEANVMYRKLGQLVDLPQRAPYVVGLHELIPSDPPEVRIRALNHRLVPLTIPLGETKLQTLTDPNGTKPIRVFVMPGAAASLGTLPRLYLAMAGMTQGYEYSLDASSIRLIVPGAAAGQIRTIEPAPAASDAVATPRLFAFGREGNRGQQLRGGSDQYYPPIAVFRFRGADLRVAGPRTPMELKVAVERGGSAALDETPTLLDAQVYNHTTKRLSEVVSVPVESLRTAFFSLPTEDMQGGDFDVRMTNRTPGHYAGLAPASLGVVTAERSFAGNLSRSLLVLWLLAILVVAVSVFCSTFLSWPIAVVLTLVILLGHWGVEQLGDTVDPGLGRRFVVEVGLEDPAVGESVSQTVEALARGMGIVQRFLPDLSAFPVTEQIERGAALPMREIAQAAIMSLGFAIPLVVLAYVFLKEKEVAP
jgi:hypothetical protein